MSIIPVYSEPIFPTIDPSEIYEDDEDDDQWTRRQLNQSMLEQMVTAKNVAGLLWKTWHCITANLNQEAEKTHQPI